MKSHENPKEQYNCPVCCITLNSRMTYMKHTKNHYSEYHKCEICEKVFTRPDSLKTHKKEVHEKHEVSGSSEHILTYGNNLKRSKMS